MRNQGAFQKQKWEYAYLKDRLIELEANSKNINISLV